MFENKFVTLTREESVPHLRHNLHRTSLFFSKFGKFLFCFVYAFILKTVLFRCVMADLLDAPERCLWSRPHRWKYNPKNNQRPRREFPQAAWRQLYMSQDMFLGGKVLKKQQEVPYFWYTYLKS